MSTPAVAVSSLSKYFPQIELRHLLTGRRLPGVWALKEAAFELFPWEDLCITGPKGSGKSGSLRLGRATGQAPGDAVAVLRLGQIIFARGYQELVTFF
jgi:ABC-type polysaccharide/polyol phosphate transport system ATPase subunit